MKKNTKKHYCEWLPSQLLIPDCTAKKQTY